MRVDIDTVDAPGGPGSRNTDPDTSHEASALHKRERITHRRLVMCIHGANCGLTDYELADLTGLQQNSCGKRRGELRDKGYIYDTGQRRPAPSGANAIVWDLTAKGEAWVMRYVLGVPRWPIRQDGESINGVRKSEGFPALQSTESLNGKKSRV